MIKTKFATKAFDVVNTLIMLLVIFITAYPFIYTASVSLSGSYAVSAGLVKFLPVGLNIQSYKKVLNDPRIWVSYKNTIMYTTVGTFFNLLITSMMAYALSRKSLTWRRPILMLVTFTMLFSGGMIPNYTLINKLGLIDNFWVMVIPSLISTWNLMVMRTFFEGIPVSLHESAYLDGASEYQVFLFIILPLSVTILLTIGLFYAVSHWNSFFNALIYLNTPDKFPLQIILRNIVIAGQTALQEANEMNEDVEIVVPESIKSATIMVATVPILCIYPFIQKYFIKGVMIGAVKG